MLKEDIFCALLWDTELNKFIGIFTIRDFLNLFKEEVDLRSERMDCILKSRILLSRIYQAQGLFLNASGIALKALENNTKYIEYQVCGIENADDFICKKIFYFIYNF